MAAVTVVMFVFLEKIVNIIAPTACSMTDQGLDNMPELVDFSESNMKTLAKIIGTQGVRLKI